MTKRRKLIVLAAATCATCAPGAPASAQSGVFVDPGSPSGKEYAIPLEDARRDADPSGQGGAVEQGDRSAALFGAGVGDDGKGGSGGQPKSSGKHSQGTSEHGGGGPTVGAAIQSTRPVTATVPDGGLGSAASIAAVALSVLLLGGVIGSIARRRSS